MRKSKDIEQLTSRLQSGNYRSRVIEPSQDREENNDPTYLELISNSSFLISNLIKILVGR